MLKVGSLFSGIGGLELGLERTGGFKTIWNCEIDPWAAAVLKKHWPGVENLGDITKIDWGTVQRPDLICGGFPCQDISQAGRQAGIREGKRSGLWSEYAKAIRILRPKYALIENVPALTYLGLDVVLADLAEIGYDAEWAIISAADVGAPHLRERIFVVAYPAGFGRRGEDKREVSIFGSPIWKLGTEPALSGRGLEDVADPNNTQTTRYGEHGREVYPITKSEGLNLRRSAGWWAVEPDVGRVAHGVPHRVDRIKCLGNAVVPQVAQVIGELILEVELYE